MRLLHTGTLQLEEFADDEVPRYAILSHRWQKDEYSFEDMRSDNGRQKTGWSKIDSCCRLASENSINHLWVDTCCIDKSSSAELSEAINSMHRWYQNAEKCYV